MGNLQSEYSQCGSPVGEGINADNEIQGKVQKADCSGGASVKVAAAGPKQSSAIKTRIQVPFCASSLVRTRRPDVKEWVPNTRAR